ncbi:S41 family peptidase [Fulvivirgaceae bacterium BMA10]|uniref:S41 family peptidase n=1 Tax=Splendidivirga corallicola TaxID=3051826 RepID=A0ABT8KRB6_9BACT|nr:S41 family peptidase [Fulvivirgaceae bacterium BMA10]
MKNKLLHAFVWVLLSGLVACESFLIGDEPTNTAENNFEILWEQFDRWYGLFLVKDIDWHQIYSDYRPRVTSTTTDTELWQIVTEMLEELNDSHTEIWDPRTGRRFISGFADNLQARKEFDLQLIEQKYLDNHFEATGDQGMVYGSINNEIGYIHVFNFESHHREIDHVMNQLSDFKGIILDLRNTSGGENEGVIGISGRFADQRRFINTVQTRNGPEYDDFDEPIRKYVKPGGDYQYTQPVVLLTDRFTISAAESLSLYMVSLPHVTQVGDSTAGAFSDSFFNRFLPNGWIYTMSYQLVLLPDGTSPEEIGVIPEIFLKNTETDIASGNDKVLEFAIDYLN